nr:AMP-binding protein [Pseudoduganella ginsengisoli]
MELHPDLCVLLSTSGTTGSPKLVRLSRKNIEANAGAIATYLGLTPDDRAITTLPLYYSYGMSVLNSHLFAGATVLLTERALSENEFWQFFESGGATSFSGVPFSFDVLERISFRTKNYPTLRYIAQAGGRLPAEQVRQYGTWARDHGKQLFVMYGQTEAAPRMAYLPPDLVLNNTECIGLPVPGGEFLLAGDDGAYITEADRPGELVYRGPNVMMGYAETLDDLAKPQGPDLLHTGDIACQQANGLYRIIGRRNRFSKILGLRISLDELERWMQQRGWHGIVTGDDRIIVVAVSDDKNVRAVQLALLERYALPASAIVVLHLDPLPLLPSGKFDYRGLLRAGQEASTGQGQAQTLLEGYRQILGIPDILPTDSFLDTGGDSVNFVEISLLLEQHLGRVPENWEVLSISALEAMREEAATVAESSQVPRRFWIAGCIGLGLLLAGEAALQIRTYLKTGRTALTQGNDAYLIEGTESEARRYRPNQRFTKHSNPEHVFVINSQGLRSPEIPAGLAPDELRIAVIGASAVAGEYAVTNDETFPALLQEQLRQQQPRRTVNVVNAGIEGAGVNDLVMLAERVVAPLHPTAAVIYPGMNDLSLICKTPVTRKHEGLPAPEAPDWIMTSVLIAKNAMMLRERPARVAAFNLQERFPSDYSANLERAVATLRAKGIPPMLMTVARGFAGGNSELARSALYYAPCLDEQRLVELSNMFNDAIRSTGQRLDVPVLDLASVMQGGSRYFVDSSHFTQEGEQFVASYLATELSRQPWMQQHPQVASSSRHR